MVGRYSHRSRKSSETYVKGRPLAPLILNLYCKDTYNRQYDKGKIPTIS